jgi:protein gp37
MAENSGVSWTDASNGPWRGCRKVSAGCARCYAAEAAKRFGWDFSTVRRTTDKTFYAPLKWEPKRVFVCPESDFFIEDADEWRDDYWEKVIRARPDHTFIIPTKRPENIAARLPKDWGDGWPWVFLGVSVERQPEADERIPELLKCPGNLWISAEPLLEAVSLRRWLDVVPTGMPRIFPLAHTAGVSTPRLGGVILGGESGPSHRPMDPAWVQSLVAQCDAAKVPVFVKQASAFRPGQQGDLPSHLWQRKELPW